MKTSQKDRLLMWLRQNPGSSGMEIITALRMPKYTSRISDLRAAGHIVECRQDKHGVDRYYLVVPLKGEQVELGLSA